MLQPSKFSGPRILPARVFSDASVVSVRPLTELFNAYPKEKELPSELTLANVKKEPDDPTNYIPISNTPNLSITYEKFYKGQLENYLHAKNKQTTGNFVAGENILKQRH